MYTEILTVFLAQRVRVIMSDGKCHSGILQYLSYSRYGVCVGGATITFFDPGGIRYLIQDAPNRNGISLSIGLR